MISASARRPGWAAAAAALVASLPAGCGSHRTAGDFAAAQRQAAGGLAAGAPWAAAAPGAPAPSSRSAAPDQFVKTAVAPAGSAPAPAATVPAGRGLWRSSLASAPRPGPPGSSATGADGAADAGPASSPPARPGDGGGRRGGSPAGEVAGRPSTAAPGSGAPPDVVLGSFGTASGPIGANVAAIPVAVQAWAATVNAGGGLAGHPVRVVFGDDGGDPGRALALARRMVEVDHAVAFVGTHGPTTLQAVIPYAEQHRIPIVGGTTSLDAEDRSPMVFNPQVGLLGAGRGFVTTVVRQTAARQASLIYCREVAGCRASRDVIAAFAGEAGLRIVHEAQVSLAQPDFTAEVVAGRQAGADVVIGVVDVASMLRYIRAAQRQGWKPVFSGSFAFDTPDAERAGPEAEGLLAFSGTVNFDASARLADYRRAVATYVPGGALGGPGAHAWAQGRLLEAAARPVPGALTSAALLDGLLALHGETLGGIVPPLTFPDGPHRDVNRCIVPIRLAGGHWTQPLGDQFVCA
ncbi:MAG TPA: ABC transporter substrate-binding protein [Acidimicrobiia bacterium]|nr:ABC transporter substrate-binding protein [Acidimicrobiia bacterium]